MPNFSGVWDLKDQVQAIAAGRWTGVPTFELYAWGDNSPKGQLGDGTVVDKSSPVQIGALTNWSQVAAGSTHTAAITQGGELYAWGDNSPGGRLGDGTVVDRSSPVQIGAFSDWANIVAGADTTFAVRSNGTLWTWGEGGNGRLGHNDTVSRSSPVQLGALTTWSKVSAHGAGGHAIKTDGTLWAWGASTSGQLGDNTVIAKSSPIQIGALTTWSQVSAGNRATIHALQSDGTLWGWGLNFGGDVGDGTKVRRSSPVQIGALTTWASVSSGGYHALAVQTNGTLWSWGYNDSGQLGQNNVVFRSSPVQIGALTTWLTPAAGGYNSSAIKTDGTLWLWGRNSAGGLGDGTLVNKSSPVQLGSETWESASLSSANQGTSLGILQGSSN